MRTAVLSDIHLASLSGEDLLRDAGVRSALIEELAGAERVVLLGDALELRDLPLAEALELARPFFELLGEALAGREVVLVPGNHDHRLAEPLLERLALAGKPLGLEQRWRPSGVAGRLARWLGEARLTLAYPGLWLSEDTYAMHGHYMDCHLSLPRLECVAAAAAIRASGPIPRRAAPDDYERVLRPVYGFTFGLAQSGAPKLAGGAARPSERAWRSVTQAAERRWRARMRARLLADAVVPALVWALNRGLRAQFDPDVSARSSSAGGIRAATETVARLGIGAAHVITGHTHRAGPHDTEEGWPLAGGGRLHNTGTWQFTAPLAAPGSRESPYWPGTVTWLEDGGAPRRTSLLADRDPAELAAIVARQRVRPPASRR